MAYTQAVPSDRMEASAQVHVLINGWPLIAEPVGLQALQLAEILTILTAKERGPEVTVLLPAGEPAGSIPAVDVIHTGLTAAQGLGFEQWSLPKVARGLPADVIFAVGSSAPLLAGTPTLVWYAAGAQGRGTPASGRFRWAAGVGGLRSAFGLVFSDQPNPPVTFGALVHSPPLVSELFHPHWGEQDESILARLALERGYVLCHGIGEGQVEFVLEMWVWIAGRVGAGATLLLVNATPASAVRIEALAEELGMRETILLRDGLQLTELPAIYRGASCVLYLGAGQTGQMLRWALASGAPVAGLRTPKSDSILAEAGYLVATGDARALAGACLTLIVERGLAAELKDAGLKRAERFHGEGPVRGLLDVLTGVASG